MDASSGEVCPKFSQEEILEIAAQFEAMIAKEAWAIWRNLPAHTKTWVSFGDLQQDGRSKLVVEVLPRYDGARAALSTFICASLRNHYDEHYAHHFGRSGRREKQYQRHNEDAVIGIEDLQTERRNCWDVLYSLAPSLIDGLPIDESACIRDCAILPKLNRIYDAASETLQEEMVRWFTRSAHVRQDTAVFYVRRLEFCDLAQKEQLNLNECLHVVNTPHCMAQFMCQFCYA